LVTAGDVGKTDLRLGGKIEVDVHELLVFAWRLNHKETLLDVGYVDSVAKLTSSANYS
jgi:hypothetical protein